MREKFEHIVLFVAFRRRIAEDAARADETPDGDGALDFVGDGFETGLLDQRLPRNPSDRPGKGSAPAARGRSC